MRLVGVQVPRAVEERAVQLPLLGPRHVANFGALVPSTTLAAVVAERDLVGRVTSSRHRQNHQCSLHVASPSGANVATRGACSNVTHPRKVALGVNSA